jgi:hypothetical protein
MIGPNEFAISAIVLPIVQLFFFRSYWMYGHRSGPRIVEVGWDFHRMLLVSGKSQRRW